MNSVPEVMTPPSFRHVEPTTFTQCMGWAVNAMAIERKYPVLNSLVNLPSVECVTRKWSLYRKTPVSHGTEDTFINIPHV